MARSSNIRYLYTSTVVVTRLGMGGGAGIQDGAANYTWVESDDVIDAKLGIPGKMKCKIDLQFVRPGLNAPMPAEAGSAIPRAGTLFFDLPPKSYFVRSGDHIRVVKGAYFGALFEITAIPESAQDVRGPTHMEAQIVEKGIDTDLIPTPGDVLR